MFAKIKQIFNPKNKDLQKRILFTFVALFIFKLGTTIVVPGVEQVNLETSKLGFLELVNVMGGGALQQCLPCLPQIFPQAGPGERRHHGYSLRVSRIHFRGGSTA